MPKVRSVLVPTALGRGAKKLGQPVPLSNFVEDSNKGRPQDAQAYLPAPMFLVERTGTGAFRTVLTHDGESLRR